MRNPVGGDCLKAYTNQNVLSLLYALKLDPELLTDEATAAFQLADGLHEENEEETAWQKLKREQERNKARWRVALELLSGDNCPVKLKLITGHRFCVTYCQYVTAALAVVCLVPHTKQREQHC